jgi:hypothetical protein
MMNGLKQRIGHWPSTALGLASAGVLAYCQSGALLQDWKAWLPIVGLAIWGAAIKGPAKNTLGPGGIPKG